MLRADTFWTYEGDAPLLNLNKGYLQAQGDTLFARVGTWLPSAGVAPGDGVEIAEEQTDPERKRIIVADAERTFRHDSNRAIFVRLLTHLNNKFGDYAQGLSYVASFLSIYLPQSDVVALTSELNFNPKYLPGYWKHEAIKFATDAYVFQELAIKYLPTVAEHLQKNGVDPSSYCQKWFVGLCVHVLPYEHLFKYFEGFLAGGHKFLMQFGLSLLNQLQDKLLAIQLNFSAFLGLLRLDPKFIPHDDKFDEMMNRVFDGVKDFNLDDVNFAEMRVYAYDKYLAKRIESAKKQAEEEIEEIEDCQICLDDFPEVYCKECNLKICESCHNKPPADSKHSRSHKVKEIVEDEDEEEEGDDEDDEEKKDDSVDKATAGLEKLNVK